MNCRKSRVVVPPLPVIIALSPVSLPPHAEWDNGDGIIFYSSRALKNPVVNLL
jgi:hypothetical protein